MGRPQRVTQLHATDVTSCEWTLRCSRAVPLLCWQATTRDTNHLFQGETMTCFLRASQGMTANLQWNIILRQTHCCHYQRKAICVRICLGWTIVTSVTLFSDTTSILIRPVTVLHSSWQRQEPPPATPSITRKRFLHLPTACSVIWEGNMFACLTRLSMRWCSNWLQKSMLFAWTPGKCPEQLNPWNLRLSSLASWGVSHKCPICQRCWRCCMYIHMTLMPHARVLEKKLWKQWMRFGVDRATMWLWCRVEVNWIF